MNIRMPNQASAPDSVPGPQPSNSVQGANVEAGPPSANQGTAFHDSTNYGAPPGMPVWAPHGIGPTGIAPTQQGFPQEEERRAVSSELRPSDHFRFLGNCPHTPPPPPTNSTLTIMSHKCWLRGGVGG